MAPGVNVRTSDLSFGGLPAYASVSGTSFAAPHIAGALALLAGAFPAASVAQLESALTQSARDVDVTGTDNNAGYGLADALAAYDVLAAGAGSPPSISSAPVSTATQGQPYRYQVMATDADGGVLSYALDTAPSGMSIDAAGGLIAWTPGAGQAGVQAVRVRVTDESGLSALQAFSISVALANGLPVAANDAYGAPQWRSRRYTPRVFNVLANDRDSDGTLNPATLSIVGAPNRGGTATANADGSVSYTPPLSYRGLETFEYTVKDDRGATSNTATVTIRVR